MGHGVRRIVHAPRRTRETHLPNPLHLRHREGRNSVGSWRGTHDLPDRLMYVVYILTPMIGQPAEMQESFTIDEADIQQAWHRTLLTDQIPHELGGLAVVPQFVLSLS